MSRNNVVLILLIKALLIGAFIVWGPIGLGPDEAHYWTWSKNLDWGYYSKPPGIAWQIWTGIQLFGDTELGVRFGSILLGLALPAAVFLLARDCSSSNKTPLYAALAMALSPLGVLASFLAITDTGLALFWTLATWALVHALHKQEKPNYILVGCFIALAAIFKWPAYAFWLIIAGMYPFYPEIRSRSIWGGLTLSLIGIAPSIYWNFNHDWASFRHVFATVIGQQIQDGQAVINTQSNFFEFLGAQAVLISPVFFVLLIAALVVVVRKKQPVSVQFLAINCFSVLGLCLFLSLFKKIQGNWGSYAYPAGVVLFTLFCTERWKSGIKWLQGGMLVSIILIVATLSVPSMQSFGVPIPYKLNPFHHNVGWKNLDQALIDWGYDPENHFLFSDKYQTTSIISFYGPGQKRAYFFNLKGARKNQFAYWASIADEQLDKAGYFIFYERCAKPKECVENYRKELSNYFDSVTYLGDVPLFIQGNKQEKTAYIFRTEGYNGKEPINFDLY